MVKEKQTRTYDPDGFRKRAACLCVHDPQENEILLVTSSRDTDHWIVPGGGVEPNEESNEAAIRETEEEAGVRGVIKRCLGDFEVRDENLDRKHRTSVYVLEVKEELDEWEDSKCRLRRWFPVEEALRLLAIHKPVQCTYIRLLIQTSTSLPQLLPHLLTFDEASLSSLSCKSSPNDPSSATAITSRYLQVNHYPRDGNSTNNNGNSSGSSGSFRTFICSRDVYSTDSETADDGSSGVVEPANHFNSSDVNSIETESSINS